MLNDDDIRAIRDEIAKGFAQKREDDEKSIFGGLLSGQGLVGLSPSRPILEAINTPLYSSCYLKANKTYDRVYFFTTPIGAMGDDGEVTTFAKTNMRRAGSLSTPQKFYATSVVVMPDYADVPEGPAIREAYRECVEIIRDRCTLAVGLGMKTFLRAPGRLVIAQKEAMRRDSREDRVEPLGDDPCWDRWFPLGLKPHEIPDSLREHYEELFKSCKTDKIPLLIPSEQQIDVTLDFEMKPVKLPMDVRLTCFLGGTLFREVQ